MTKSTVKAQVTRSGRVARNLTTHSTGALDSMAFMLVFSDNAVCFSLAPG
jgi:hypothetical protein